MTSACKFPLRRKPVFTALPMNSFADLRPIPKLKFIPASGQPKAVPETIFPTAAPASAGADSHFAALALRRKTRAFWRPLQRKSFPYIISAQVYRDFIRL